MSMERRVSALEGKTPTTDEALTKQFQEFTGLLGIKDLDTLILAFSKGDTYDERIASDVAEGWPRAAIEQNAIRLDFPPLAEIDARRDWLMERFGEYQAGTLPKDWNTYSPDDPPRPNIVRRSN